jgi:hypothetical protein
LTDRPLRLLRARVRLSVCVLLSVAPALAFAQSRNADPSAVESAPSTLNSPGGLAAAASAAASTVAASASASTANDAQEPAPPDSPLAIHVGSADLLIGGFLDMTSVTRSTNTGNGLGTNFSNFPFTTTATGTPNPTGNLAETRFSAQNSRVFLQATSKVGSAEVKGYVEADFLGNTAQNLNVTSNSDGLRMRLYWAQLQTGKFEFLAGQSWSFMTPNRNGLSPMPGDVFYTQDMDTNYQLGLPWGRTPGFRFIAHASDAFSIGVALENPEQYVGGAVVLPKAFTTAEVDTGSGSSAVGSSSPTPNPYPDIIGKVAFDPKIGNTHQHIDAAFVVSGFKTFNATTNTAPTQTGYAESVNFIIEPVRNFKLIATNFFSNGDGRYIGNTGIPDFIVNPDFSMSLVKSWSGIYGTEITAKNTLLFGYYSLAHVTQNTTLDADGKTVIGYGVAASQTPNQKMDEATVGLNQTFFRDPKIGAMQLIIQYSNLQRTPFSVPAGTPANAKMNMVYIDVRYTLP